MQQSLKTKLPYVITGCLSAALFYIFYGFRVLDPRYVDWLLTGGDPTQHYLGWALYRNSPFYLQIGLMNTASYPFEASVMFTDSIPLMAILCKFIGLTTNVPFQYFGIWGLACLVLMGVLTCFLLKKYINNPIVLVLASILITASPCLLRRLFWHTSLGSHFLIILGLILIAYRHELCYTPKRASCCWAFLAFLCSFIHLYFLAMNAFLLLCYICFRLTDKMCQNGSEPNVSPVAEILLSAVSYFASATASVWLLGGFSSGMDKGAPGLAYYSFNLNGFINPDGWSSVLPELPRYAGGQYEGFAYLGLGILTALFILIISAVYGCFIKTRKTGSDRLFSSLFIADDRSKGCKTSFPFIICLLFVVLINILISASNEITFGDILLLKIPIPEAIENIWSIFRASGRLIWPAVYIICISVIVLLSRTLKPNVLIAVLVLCVLLQLADMRLVIEDKHYEFDRRVRYSERLDDEMMNRIMLMKDIKHIVFIDKDNLTQEEMYAFTELAARRRMTVNDFYFARNLSYPVNETTLSNILSPDDDTMYVLSPESHEFTFMFDMYYYKYGDLTLGFKSPL